MTEVTENQLNPSIYLIHGRAIQEVLYEEENAVLTYEKTTVQPDCSLPISIEQTITLRGFTPPPLEGTAENYVDRILEEDNSWNLAAISYYENPS